MERTQLKIPPPELHEWLEAAAIRSWSMTILSVNHEKGWLECGSSQTGYGPDVAEAYQRRIGFCLQLHNESVKAMRYPLNAHRKELAAAEGAREREKELAMGIQDRDLDDDDPLGDF